MSKRRRAWNAYYSGANAKSILGASLLVWYRADMGVSLNGSTVSAWNDSSGTGDANKNAIQASVPLQPTFNAANASYGGKPTITFPDSTLLVTGTFTSALAQPLTRFAVCNSGAAAPGDFVMDSLSAVTEYALFGDTCAIFNAVTLDSTVSLVGTPSIIWAIDNGASSKIACRQNTANASGNSGGNGAAGLTIGNTAGGGASSLAGPIAEIIIASGALSQATINRVTAYLAARYGLTQGP